MTGSAPSLTYVGGPTAVLDWGGLRILTDPTFDPAPTVYELPGYTLRKTQGPAVAADAIGPVDVVLLSHEHHVDNLDRAGRALLPSARRVLTTEEGVEVARAMPSALIVPLHFEGWEHFSESREDVERAFANARLSERLRWPVAGEPIAIA